MRNGRCRFNVVWERPYLVDLRHLQHLQHTHVQGSFHPPPLTPEIKNERWGVHRTDVCSNVHSSLTGINMRLRRQLHLIHERGCYNVPRPASHAVNNNAVQCLSEAEYLKLSCYFHRKTTWRKYAFPVSPGAPAHLTGSPFLLCSAYLNARETLAPSL